MMVLAETEMPFTDQSSRIARAAKNIGDGPLIERQTKFAFLADVWVELMAESRLGTAREQACTRRTAIRCRDVAAGASNARSRQFVDVRRRHRLAAVDADVAVAQIIGDDDQDVWLRPF